MLLPLVLLLLPTVLSTATVFVFISSIAVVLNTIRGVENG